MSKPQTAHSLSHTFAQLRQQQRIGLFPFIPAGYPDLDTTAALLAELEQAGASAVEIGFPFSDPVADGPVIQHAFVEALKQGLHVHSIFETVSKVRPTISLSLIAMVSYSIVYRYGVDRFLADAGSSGFDAILIPDLPPPEADQVCQKIRAAGLDTVLLVAPTTSVDRRKEIADLCSGFIYYLSVSGVTGARASLPDDLQANVRQLREATSVPVVVGFGVSTRAHVEQLSKVADAAIVGSALVRQITAHRDEGVSAICQAVGAFCRQLTGAAPVGR